MSHLTLNFVLLVCCVVCFLIAAFYQYITRSPNPRIVWEPLGFAFFFATFAIAAY